MNAREKILASVVGGLLGLTVVGLGIRSVFLGPLREADKKLAALREKQEKVTAEKRAYFAAEEAMNKLAQRCFADSAEKASARSGEMLTRTIINSGLSESKFSRLPAAVRKLRGAYETGWTVRGEGPLPKVINLVFLLEESPPVHRIENLVLAAGELPGQVNVSFRYLTIVLDPAPVVESADLETKLMAEGPERRVYDPLVTRDILRPYVKAPPPTLAPKTPGSPAAPAPTTPGPETFQVVSLSEWQGQPEVHVRDLTNQKTLLFKVGDSLGGGTIVMVDYRPLPMPGKPGLQSFSRVIIQIGNRYWAVERGGTLADRHILVDTDVPENLPKL